jgi:two-component system, OmpR family, sensor histidine kinase KdpD
VAVLPLAIALLMERGPGAEYPVGPGARERRIHMDVHNPHLGGRPKAAPPLAAGPAARILGAMRAWWWRALPYVTGAAGVALVTVLIGAVRPMLVLSNLSAAYLLLVLWLSARWGWRPALTTALLAFAAYDWFLVEPYGTLYISAPRDLLDLALLLAAALLGARLASTLARQRAGAVAEAAESGILYEVAIAALGEPDGTEALSLLCRRAVDAGGLQAMALLAGEGDEACVVAGEALSAADLRQARWAAGRGIELGARLEHGELRLMRIFSPRREPRLVKLSGGAAVFWPHPDREPSEDQRHLLAALLGLAGLLLDRRRAGPALERARALEASDRLKTAVLSSLSHELKTPIASLRAGLTTLSMPEAGLAAEQRELVAGLDRQATRLDRLVSDLLTMARLEAEVGLELAPQRLDELLGSVLRSLGPQLDGFDVRVEVPPDLPPLLGDELQVQRVLTNLLENATEWAPPGGRIGVGAARSGDQLSVWVENEGPRIASDELERVFEKFWTRRKGGSGLGLAISRRIVEAHGGAIQVENRAEGPRFTLRLPLAAAVPAAEASTGG